MSTRPSSPGRRLLGRSAGDPTLRQPLYLHGIPTSSDDFVPFLERTGGVAPDLIGFGRSGKGGHLDYSIDGHADFVSGCSTTSGSSESGSSCTTGALPRGLPSRSATRNASIGSC